MKTRKEEIDGSGHDNDYIDPTPAKQEPVKVEKLPGRNDPCPCGSGKKFKQCHGKDM